MRIVSLVPSLTETLAAAATEDLQVVGRTRFCIHPHEQVVKIPVVGGTKDIDWEKLKGLQPDMLILDKEENPLWMAEQAPCPIYATHVCDIASLTTELHHLSSLLDSAYLRKLAERSKNLRPNAARLMLRDLRNSEKLLQLTPEFVQANQFAYVIWRNPWMVVGAKTFIGSVCRELGISLETPDAPSLYPEVDEEFLKKRFCLFSTEPFPFHKKADSLHPFSGAIVDGESFSWFGLRTIEFLESLSS